MTETNQNIDTHDTAVSFVPNRVNCEVLDATQPRNELTEFDNAKFLCCPEEHRVQRENYIVLVERIITSDIKCLQFLHGVATKHISHKHAREMSKKCHMVS